MTGPVSRAQAMRAFFGVGAVSVTVAGAVLIVRSQEPPAPPPALHPPLRVGVLVDEGALPASPGRALAPLSVTEYDDCPTTSVTGPCAVYAVPGAGLITYDLTSKCMRHVVTTAASYGFAACDHPARRSARGIAPDSGY